MSRPHMLVTGMKLRQQLERWPGWTCRTALTVPRRGQCGSFLAAQQWRSNHTLETAFFEGYGSDPREGAPWNMMMLREAVGTAAWAFQVGDHEFEQQGHRMIGEALVNY